MGSRQKKKQQSKQKRGGYRRGSRIVLASIVLVLIVAVTIVVVRYASGGTGGENASGGTGGKSGTGEVISPTWMSAEAVQTKGDAVSIPAGEVDSGKMLHFAANFGEGTRQNFMAYISDGETHVRANVCPPCRSVGFSLAGDILVCDSCGTRFTASTGVGISGACKDYPKAEVAHTISDGTITMEMGDLLAAYQNTEKPGWP